MEAKRLLLDIAAGDQPSTLKELTAEPERETRTYEIEGRGYEGDLYRPAEGEKAALVLVPGATPRGKDDPRLVALARSLARSGFLVLVPDIENLRELKLRPDDAQAIADAARFLAGLESGEPVTQDRPVGLAAISYAGGPAVLAALEDDLRDRIAFLLLIGGYYDMEAVVAFFTTGYYREQPGAAWRYRRPNVYGKWVLVKSNAARLSDQRDRVLIGAMAERKLSDPEAEIADLVKFLGDEGLSVHALLENEDPDRVPALIADLPPSVRTDMAALDLKTKELSRLTAPLILIHGRDDPIIPFSESAALAAALREDQADLYVLDALSHVDLGPGGLSDAMALWQAAYRLLELRDQLCEVSAKTCD